MKNKLKNCMIISAMVALFFIAKASNASNVEVELSDKFLDVKQTVIEEYKKNSLWRSDDILDKNSMIIKFLSTATNFDIDIFEREFNLKNKRNLNSDLKIYYYEMENEIEMSLNFLTNINKSLLVEYVEPNYRCSINDEPYYYQLWGLKNQNYLGVDINVENAWKKTKGNNSVIVAVIDSGIDYNHIDLKNNIWKNTKEFPNNNIDDDKNGYIDDVLGWDFYNKDNDPMDDYSHGTHISGTIAASENEYGIIGIAPNVKLMALKIFGQRGGASSFSDIISAIEYAHKAGASIVNMSFGGKGNSVGLYESIKYFKDMLFISAAGNNATNNDYNPFYPANYDVDNNISVSSIDINKSLSYFSNFGFKSVDIAAPGSSIYSTMPGGKYGYMQGTSMATPHISGACALVKSYDFNLTPAQIKQIILSNVKPLSTLTGKIKTEGIVDCNKALDILSSKQVQKPISKKQLKK